MNNKLLENLNIKKKKLSGGEIKKKLSPMSEKYRLYLQRGGMIDNAPGGLTTIAVE